MVANRLVKWWKSLPPRWKALWAFNFIFGSAFIFGLIYVNYHYNYLLPKNHKWTVGKVIVRQNRRYSEEYVFCRYWVDGKAYKRSARIDNFEYMHNVRIELDDKFYVMYYPADPSIAEVELEKGIIPDSIAARLPAVMDSIE